MMVSSDAAVWLAASPSAWPTAPEYMSFSTLSELEACPRRWALSAAAYPEVWENQGYPRALHTAAMEGTVAHLALDMITRAFADCGCPSVRDPGAIAILRELGGFTEVIRQAIDKTLRWYHGNPRAVPAVDRMRRHLTARTAALRSRVQGFLSRVRLEARPRTGPSHRYDNAQHQDLRDELLTGSHSEVHLVVEELGWKGVADLITLSESACEIRDFKTGAPKEDHHLQLRIYAVLWWLDRVRNPTGRLADRLVISYDPGDVEVIAPSVSMLESLRSELGARRVAAIQTLDVDPPEARPSATTCAYCGVRHLCDAYWRTPFPPEGQGAWFTDIQLELTARHGTTSWDGVVESCSGLARRSRILLRTIDIPFDLCPGMQVRVLNVRVSAPDVDSAEGEPAPAVASMGLASEIFVLPG